MEVYIRSDYEAGTWIEREVPSFVMYDCFKVDLPEELILKSERIASEYNLMQEDLSKIWGEARRKARLASTKDGVQPKGFN